MKEMKQIFEISRPGRTACTLPECDVPGEDMGSLIFGDLLRQEDPLLPEVSEIDAVRHFVQLSRRNHGVDS